MKKLLLSFAVLCAANSSFGQERETVKSTVIPIEFHGVTGNLRDFIEAPGTVNEITKTEKLGYHAKNDWGFNPNVNPNALPVGTDPALQTVYSPAASGNKALVASWEGQGYSGVNPADPSVDVGPNHVVQMINGSSGSYIQIWSKTGTSLMSPVYFDNFMSMAGGAGDPIVVYDQRADRWLLSEFSNSGNNMHVAISQTNDPTGAYYTYSFNAPAFPDYPKYSVWEDEYIITANVGTADIYALDRTSLLAGTPASAQQFLMSNFGTIGFQAATPVSLNGNVLPPSGTPAMVMRMRDDAWTGASSDALEIWEVDIDWSTPGNSSFSQTNTLPTLPHDSELCGYTSFQCIPQPGSGTTLDPLRELLMNRIHYRNFGTHESIVCCHVTDVDNTDHAGIRWYELRRTGGSAGTWAIYQQGTYSPDADHRFMPSIGISASGNIGLAYNVSSSAVYPSIRYTGRKECDPLGSMTEPETVIIAGTASNASNRYGDYNAMGLDPVDGETFYFTGVYNPASSWSTRIGKFNIDLCAMSTEVQFGVSTLSVNESDATVASSTCLDYSIINVPIEIGVAPSANADIVVSATGGTATLGEDFSLNNATLTLNGGNLTANVEVWVYNDDIVEGTENIILTYTLNANSGDAIAGATNQSVDITINDDDIDPSLMTVTTVVYSENLDAGFGLVTTVNPSLDTPFQVDNAANASSGAFAVPTSNTTTFAWVNDDDCNCDQDDVDLILPIVDLSGFSSATFTFSSYFRGNTYSGNTETAEVFVSDNGAAAVSLGSIVTGAAWVNQSFDLTPYVGSANIVLSINYSDGTGWLYGCAIDDLNVSGQTSLGVQTAINSGNGYTADLGANATVNFYDPTSSEIMMTLENTSSFDYGCVTVEVDRDGTSSVQFNSPLTANFLHSKSFRIIPTNTNPTGTVNVSVYYEEAEVAGWETATGSNRNAAELVKVAGANAINDVNPGNAGTFLISNSGSTISAFNSDVIFTGAISTGLNGGFGVGIYNSGIPTSPTANFISDVTTICEGSTVTFTDLSGGVPTSWMWNFGDGSPTSSLQNPSHTYTVGSVYTVTLTATNANGSTTSTSTITVNAASTNTLSYDLCQGASVTVGSNTYSTAGTYTDVLPNAAGCDSTITTTIVVNPNPTVTTNPTAIGFICVYADPITLVGTPSGGTFSGNGVNGNMFEPATAGAGNQTITYSYTDANGCSNTSTISAQVDGCAGIEEETLNGVSVSPNPNNGEFVINGLENGTEFNIYDEKGSLVYNGVSESESTEVKLKSIETGIYYLKSSKDGKEGEIKFLIVD